MENKYNVTVFRYDNYFDSIEEAQVTHEVPVGVWLPAYGGGYIYLKTREEAVQIRRHNLEDQLKEIQDKLAQIDKGE